MNANDYTSLWENDTERKELARYLNGVGRGLNCRLDVPVIILEDIKWAGFVFEQLAKDLNKLAFDDERPDIYRVLAARYAMEGAKRTLQQKNNRAEAMKLQRKNREKKY